jgi:CRISPR-associated protein Cas2
MYLFAYDITDNKRRHLVSKELERFGIRIQKSFFQCDVSPEMADSIKMSLLSLINEKEDSLILYPVCSDCLGQARLLGNGQLLCDVKFEIL